MNKNQQETTEPSKRRILILGSSNHTKLVKAYEWDNLPSNLNISDFDTVILNFSSFKIKSITSGINIDMIPDWISVFPTYF